MKKSTVPKQRRRVSKKVVIAASVAAAVTLGLAGGVLTMLLNRDRVELSSGNFSITQTQYATLIEEAKKYGVGEVDARDKLLYSLRIQDAAEQVGVKPESYVATAGVLALGVAGAEVDVATQPYAQRIQYADAVGEYMTFHQQGGYRYLELQFPFTRYIYGPDVPGMIQDVYDNPRSEEKILADMAHAKAQAQAFRKKLVAGELSPEAAIVEVSKDDRLTYGGAANDSTIQTMGLDGTSLLGGMTVQADEAQVNFVKGLKVGKVTEVIERMGGRIDGVTSDRINAGEDRMRIAYAVVKLLDKNDPRPGIIDEYKKKLTELDK